VGGFDAVGNGWDWNPDCEPPMIEESRRKENAMAESAKPQPTQETFPPDPYPDYRPVYSWVFQSWLIMFLAVICLALFFYLIPYLKSGWDWFLSLF
jgi:hypothetical protein